MSEVGTLFYVGNTMIGRAYLGEDLVALNPFKELFSPDEYAEYLVMASPGNSSYSQSLNMIYPWSDISADIKGFGVNKTMNSSSIGLYQSSSLDNWGYYGGSTYVSGSIVGGVSQFMPYSQNNTDFNFGSGSYTIETWVNLGPLTSGSFTIATKYVPTVPAASEYDFSWNAVNPGQNRLVFAQQSGGELVLTSSAFTSDVNEWHHIAVTKDAPNNNTVRLYLDGNLVGAASGAAWDNSNTTTTPLRMFGRVIVGSGTEANIFYQDFRIYKGIAKYTGTTYTLPDSMILQQ